MKNTVIRNQCADMLRHIRKNERCKHINYNPIRSTTTEDIFSFNISFVCLHDLTNEAKRLGVPFKDVCFYTENRVDHDGYNDTILIGTVERVMTDQEYRDYLCSLILPSEYEMNEYKQYLMLKQKYEREV